MKRFMKAISMASIAGLLMVVPAWAADDEAAPAEEATTLVVPAAPDDPAGVGWYEITVLAGVPQDATAFDQAGEVLAQQGNPAVSGQAGTWWCAAFAWVKDRCDKCAEVAANSGCGQ